MKKIIFALIIGMMIGSVEIGLGATPYSDCEVYGICEIENSASGLPGGGDMDYTNLMMKNETNTVANNWDVNNGDVRIFIENGGVVIEI